MTPEALIDLFVLSPVGLAEVDQDGRVEVANLAARSLLAPFTLGTSLDNLWVALAEVAPDVASRARTFDAPRGVVIERLELLASGQARGVIFSLVKTAPGRYVAIATDAADLAGARIDIERLMQHQHAVDNAVRDYAIYTLDPDGRIASWSESAARVFQYPAEEVVGQSRSVLHPVNVPESLTGEMLELASRDGWCEQESDRRRRDGTLFPASTVLTAVRDAQGRTLSYTVVTRDLTDQKRLESALREDAASTSDIVTGVMSPRAFVDVATSEVARARRYGQPLTLLLIDPDNFRELAEAHGSDFSTEFLRAVAGASKHASRNTDVVARVAGEKFAVLLPSTELAGGLVLAERIRERVQRHVFSAGFASVRSTLSIGVAELEEDEPTMDRMLSQATTAVERAQAAGRNLVVGYDA